MVKNGTVIQMSGYHQYLVDLVKKLNTTNMDQVYASHRGVLRQMRSTVLPRSACSP